MSTNGHVSSRNSECGDPLVIGDLRLTSRLLLGTSGYPNMQVLLESISASGTELITMAIRRVNLEDEQAGGFLSTIRSLPVNLLPNTAGCFTAREAVLVAELAREALETDLIKLEVIGDDETLMPDSEQLLKAASDLISSGFTVMAYANDDPITCRKLSDMGCAAVMPLASPIGSGMGIVNPYNLQLIRELIPDTPLLVDAGIGTASDAAKALELGYDGVLLNTAVSNAKHPVQMAAAMRHAVMGGRLAHLGGRIPRRFYAQASSPTEGRVGSA